MKTLFSRLRAAAGTPPGALVFAGSLMVSAIAVYCAATAFADPTDTVQTRLQAHFPKTRITRVDCKDVISDLCEVTAGSNLFYASKDARYVVIGSVLDLEKKVDLTDERLRQLAAVEGAVRNVGGTVAPPSTAPAASRIKVDLPLANAIVHHSGAPVKVKVFSDFSCGYCRAFFTQLAADPGVEVTEYPIAVLGEESRTKAKLVLCAQDRVAASDAMYAGQAVRTRSNCARAEIAVDDNTRFARANGIVGTPTIVRADGAVNPGFLDPIAFKSFVESKS